MPDAPELHRKSPRYAASLEVHAAFEGRQLVTLTREISRGGLFFFADPPPEIGDPVRLAVYAGDRDPRCVSGIVRYAMAGVGAGVEITGDTPDEIAAFQAFVDEQAASAQAWRLIGDFVRSVEEEPTDPGIDFEPKEMIDVGETGEAYRVFFRRYPPVPPEKTSLKERKDAISQAKLILSGVSSEPVGIKLHPNDRLRRAHLGQLARGAGYVAVVPPPQPGGRYSFYTLSGHEQLMIREGDRSVFPFFTTTELARIRSDGVRSVGSKNRRSTSGERPAGASIAPRHEEPEPSAGGRDDFIGDLPTLQRRAPAEAAPPLSEWTPADASTQAALLELFDRLGAETRVYTIGGVERPIRLLRNLKLLVHERGSSEPYPSMLLHDGRRMCIVIASPSGRGIHIRPLAYTDQIKAAPA